MSSAPFPNIPATPEQLTQARAYVDNSPGAAAWLKSSGLSVEQVASSPSAMQALANIAARREQSGGRR